MDEQRQDDSLEPIYSSSVPIRDVTLKTSWKQWTIEKGGEKGLGISVLMAWHNDDDDDTFPKGICQKVNVIAWLEFELAYYDVVVQYVSHYTAGTPLISMVENRIKSY